MELPEDMFDWYMGKSHDAYELEYEYRQKSRKHRRDRQERKALREARREVQK